MTNILFVVLLKLKSKNVKSQICAISDYSVTIFFYNRIKIILLFFKLKIMISNYYGSLLFNINKKHLIYNMYVNW